MRLGIHFHRRIITSTPQFRAGSSGDSWLRTTQRLSGCDTLMTQGCGTVSLFSSERPLSLLRRSTADTE